LPMVPFPPIIKIFILPPVLYLNFAMQTALSEVRDQVASLKKGCTSSIAAIQTGSAVHAGSAI
jgi:hypothetical protein